MSADPASWLGRGWQLTLALTVGVACVALLRRVSRRLFGAECALTLWLLPPLAMPASQLPHAARSVDALAGTLLVALPVGGAWPPMQAQGLDWRAAAAWLWLAGTVAWLVRAAFAQARYRAGVLGATPLVGIDLAWPVVRATSARVGPALVGAWRPRIVVPADFERRYDVVERRLILAHEAIHARRHDGWWCLLAQACAALCWFHPLAWWALGALRHDQELACDAAVLRVCGGNRRSYALAMLKTPSAMHALPVGCSWSSRHPLTERIAMLKAPRPSPRRRTAGLFAGVALAASLTGIVYAASPPAATPGSQPAHAGPEYQLDMELSVQGEATAASQARRLKLALCTKSGQPASISTHGLQLDAVPRALPGHRLRLDLSVREAPGARPVQTLLRGAIGTPLLASGRFPGGSSHYLVQVTPREGCPARTAADRDAHAPVTLRLRQGTVRGAAELIAHQAGLSLYNPQALGAGAASMRLRHVPADRAMRLVANLAGVDAVFDGSQVRFEPR